VSSNTDLRSLIKMPSAFLPITMSLAAFAVVACNIFTDGVLRQSDEGVAAHIWQLLICAQIPLVAFFLIRWLPRAPQAALRILAIQFGSVLGAAAPVYFLHL
jgi:hypothetical protein